MEWGILMVGIGLVGMVGMVLDALNLGDGNAAATIPDFEVEHESLTINLDDYQYAV